MTVTWEFVDKLSERLGGFRVLARMLLIFGCVSVVSISSCTALCCPSMMQSDADRAKYRYQSSEAFWKYNNPPRGKNE